MRPGGRGRGHVVRLLRWCPETRSARGDGHTGMIDGNVIRAVFDDPAMTQWLYVLCGPPGMMEAVERTPMGLGVPANGILSGRFDYG